MLTENELIPYSHSLLEGSKILVMAPHPDDETFGCGGSLIQHTERGGHVKVVFLTNGAKGSSRKRNKRDYISLRRMEAEKACRYLAIGDLEFWSYEDRALDISIGVSSRIVKLIRNFQPDIVYTPSPFEIHPDHRIASFNLREALKRTSLNFKMVFYEVSHPLPAVNLLVNITSVLEQKKNAVFAYGSQLEERSYDDFCLSLNRYRSFTLPPIYTHAEAFFVCDSYELIEKDFGDIFFLGINGRLKEVSKDEGTDPFNHKKEKITDSFESNKTQTQPMISVIVPTYNRPIHLKKSIESILGQTYQNFEIIIINDGGEDIVPIVEPLDQGKRISIITCEKNRGVAAARNTGIRQASGKYIAYLDDDDLFFSDHLSTVVNELNRGQYKVVYTNSYEVVQNRIGDQWVDISQRVLFNNDFDKRKLLVGNYIPTLNIAHDRSILNKTGFFDETLEVHEDWDLLIRISQKFDFYHINQITGSYYIQYPRDSLQKNKKAFLKTAQKIHSRYAHLVDDSQLIQEQENAIRKFKKEIEDLKPQTTRSDYIRSHQYRLASAFVKNKNVLVLECENGEGCFLLAEQASSVTGMSSDRIVIKYASSEYVRDNLSFKHSNIFRGFADLEKSYDIIICFSDLIAKTKDEFERWSVAFKKLIKKGGLVFFAIPLKLDSYHEIGLAWSEVLDILGDNFVSINQLGQTIFSGSNVYSFSNYPEFAQEILVENIKNRYIESYPNRKGIDIRIVIASNEPDFHLDSYNSYFLDVSNQLLDTYTANFERLGAKKEKEILTLTETIQAKDTHIKNLEASNQNKIVHISNIENALRETESSLDKKDRHIANLEEVIRNAEGQIADILGKKDSHIENLEADIGRKERFFNKSLEEKENHISNLERRQSELNELVGMLSLKNQEHEENIVHLCKSVELKDVHIYNIEFEVNRIKNSKVWKGAEFFRRIIYDRILAPFPMLRKGVLAFSDKGFHYALYKAKHYIKNRKYSPPLSIKSEYDIWVERNSLSDDQVKNIHEEVSMFSYQPKISLLMPVYNIEQHWLEKAINSVIHQYYQNWELCIVDDASPKTHIKSVLNQYAAFDDRIKIIFLQENLGISGASNAALKSASGEFVGLLDNDDELAKEALYECVKVLNADKNIDLIYSDEDKLDLNGNRTEPFFKPDFSIDLLLSMNYICHFAVLRTATVRQIGGFRMGYEGSQDYDLFLRFINITEEHRIHHIPKILYHWRKIPGSAAAVVDAKNYAFISAKKALKDYLDRNRIPGVVKDGLFLGSYRVKRKINSEKKVSIIIPFKDRLDLLKMCLESIFENTGYSNFEVLIVNNQSKEKKTLDYLDKVRTMDKIQVFDYNSRFNFSAINNFAVGQTEGEYVLLLNNDIKIISSDWLESMIEHAQRPEVGVVGAKLLFPDNRIQHAGVVMGIGIASHAFSHLPADDNGYFGLSNVIRNFCAVTGACMMFRKTVYEEVGGLDEINLSVAYNDVDFCLKVREKGYLVVYTPYAQMVHYESATRGDDNELQLKDKDPSKYARVIAEREYMVQKWSEYIQNDPYYNPNLTRMSNDFALRVES